MRINIVSNIRERKGLWRDWLILRDLCAGHDVAGVDFREEIAPKADLTIHLEVCQPRLLGRRNWLIPNPEWWTDQHTHQASQYERILCKTWDGLRLIQPLAPWAEYVGFASEDHRDRAVIRERRFWHTAGGSIVKGTDAILNAWARYELPYQLTVVGTVVAPLVIPNVTIIGRLEEEDFRREQNRHLFHLCPSRYEGFGHYLHEALGVGAIVASTDAPPMSEWHAAARLATASIEKQRLATTHAVSLGAIRRAVESFAAMSDEQIADEQDKSRAAFEVERAAFVEKFTALLE